MADRAVSDAVIFELSGVRIVLASASPYRRKLLENAGLRIDIHPADIDEDAIKQVLLNDGAANPADIAELLARTKAVAVSEVESDAFVIGADQVMAFGGRIYSKPRDIAEARDTLLELRGKTHSLISAVSVARQGREIWTHVETAHLTMREFSPQWLGTYLARAGDTLTTTVGGYAYEGIGIQLFERIEGDYFNIIGLPLLPLLAALRSHGAIG